MNNTYELVHAMPCIEDVIREMPPSDVELTNNECREILASARSAAERHEMYRLLSRREQMEMVAYCVRAAKRDFRKVSRLKAPSH